MQVFAVPNTRRTNRNLPRFLLTGYGRGTQRQVLKSKKYSGTQLGIGSGQPTNVGGFSPNASVIRVPIFCVDAVETRQTAMRTESKITLMIFDMLTLLVVDQFDGAGITFPRIQPKAQSRVSKPSIDSGN
jgi:hypothetical protein